MRMKLRLTALFCASALFCALFLLAAPPALAQQGSIRLLAVSEAAGGFAGSVADLSLDITSGSGRVFIDTLPASKVDTQLSTRFARNIACAYLDVDCSALDFFYTIRADSSLVGGPSAGAASAILTIALLDGFELDSSTAITGTIQSGNIIGPVGGLKEKIDAAGSAGITRVLIPAGTRSYELEHYNENSENSTIPDLPEYAVKNESTSAVTLDLYKYGAEKGIEIIEVSTLDDALFYYAGKRPPAEAADVSASRDYLEVMQLLSAQLCKRSLRMKENISAELVAFFDVSPDISSSPNARASNGVNLVNRSPPSPAAGPDSSSAGSSLSANYSLLFQKAENLTQESAVLSGQGKYYSAASYCFGANINYDAISLRMMNLSEDSARLEKIESEFRTAVAALDTRLEKADIRTITDLQAYSIAKDRIIESMDYFNRSAGQQGARLSAAGLGAAGLGNARLMDLAYAIERMYSAESWMAFIGTSGKVFEITDEKLRVACLNKISEAEEQKQYVLYLFNYLSIPKIDELDRAREEYFVKNYALCLHQASLAHAKANVLLSSLGVGKDGVNALLARKIDAAGKVIAKQQARGIFPIMGYSYYEYAQTMEKQDISLALLYAEYALELSNFDMYFKPKRSSAADALTPLHYFVAGILAGFAISAFAGLAVYSRKKAQAISGAVSKEKNERDGKNKVNKLHKMNNINNKNKGLSQKRKPRMRVTVKK